MYYSNIKSIIRTLLVLNLNHCKCASMNSFNWWCFNVLQYGNYSILYAWKCICSNRSQQVYNYSLTSKNKINYHVSYFMFFSQWKWLKQLQLEFPTTKPRKYVSSNQCYATRPGLMSHKRIVIGINWIPL